MQFFICSPIKISSNPFSTSTFFFSRCTRELKSWSCYESEWYRLPTPCLLWLRKREKLFLGSQLWKSSCVALSVPVKSFPAEKLAGTKNVVKTLTSKAAGWIIGRQRDFFASSFILGEFRIKRHLAFLLYFIPLFLVLFQAPGSGLYI